SELRLQSSGLGAQASEPQPQGPGLHPQGSGLCAQSPELHPQGSKLQLRSSAAPTPELFSSRARLRSLRLEPGALHLELRASTSEARSLALGAQQPCAQGSELCA